MNEYQLAVDAIDRRHQLRMKILSWVGATSLTITALWVSGIRPLEWFASATPTKIERSVPASKMTVANVDPIKAVAPRDPLPGGDSSISTTPLPLYLVATAPGKNSHQGTARIGTHVENPQTYVAGAVLANGARLVEIYADRVVLERGSKRVTLRVSSGKSTSLVNHSSAFDELALVGGTPPTQPTAITFAQDPVTEMIRAMPYYENEQMVGVQVFPGQQDGVFGQLGLQSGDVLLAIDGAPISDARGAETIREALKYGAAITVTVRRGKTTEQLSLDGAVTMKAAESSSVTVPRDPASFFPSP